MATLLQRQSSLPALGPPSAASVTQDYSAKARELGANIPPVIEDRRTANERGDVVVRRYVLGRFLGKGGFARCFKFTAVDRSRVIAGKVVDKASLAKSRARQKLLAEIRIHRSLSHRYIVGFESYFEDPANVYIMLELCPNQTMMEMVKRRKRLTEPEAQYFGLQLLDAMRYMHANCIIHRDLKLGNLFLGAQMDIKVGDFGLATQLQHAAERKRTICGTPNYIAPEVLDNSASSPGHSFEVDTWAFGVILYTMLVGKPPFETTEVKATYKRIRDNAYSFPDPRECYVSPEAQDLIYKILQSDPAARPGLEAIAKHPFFTGPHVFIPAEGTMPVTALQSEPVIPREQLVAGSVLVRQMLAAPPGKLLLRSTSSSSNTNTAVAPAPAAASSTATSAVRASVAPARGISGLPNKPPPLGTLGPLETVRDLTNEDGVTPRVAGSGSVSASSSGFDKENPRYPPVPIKSLSGPLVPPPSLPLSSRPRSDSGALGFAFGSSTGSAGSSRAPTPTAAGSDNNNNNMDDAGLVAGESDDEEAAAELYGFGEAGAGGPAGGFLAGVTPTASASAPSGGSGGAFPIGPSSSSGSRKPTPSASGGQKPSIGAAAPAGAGSSNFIHRGPLVAPAPGPSSTSGTSNGRASGAASAATSRDKENVFGKPLLVAVPTTAGLGSSASGSSAAPSGPPSGATGIGGGARRVLGQLSAAPGVVPLPAYSTVPAPAYPSVPAQSTLPGATSNARSGPLVPAPSVLPGPASATALTRGGSSSGSGSGFGVLAALPPPPGMATIAPVSSSTTASNARVPMAPLSVPASASTGSKPVLAALSGLGTNASTKVAATASAVSTAAGMNDTFRVIHRSLAAASSNNAVTSSSEHTSLADLARRLAAVRVSSYGGGSEVDSESLSMAGARVWVTTWVDYTAKYGLGYLLSSGVVGVYFNDSTKIALAADGTSVEYMERGGPSSSAPTPAGVRLLPDPDGATIRQCCTLADFPPELKKKVTLLKHFRSHLMEQYEKRRGLTEAAQTALASEGQGASGMNLPVNEAEAQAMAAGPSEPVSLLPYVRKYIRTRRAMLFRLSNHTIQVSFMEGPIIIVTEQGRCVTYVDRTGSRIAMSSEAMLSQAAAAAAGGTGSAGSSAPTTAVSSPVGSPTSGGGGTGGAATGGVPPSMDAQGDTIVVAGAKRLRYLRDILAQVIANQEQPPVGTAAASGGPGM